MITSKPTPPALLPINSKRQTLLYALEQNQVTILSAPTGSGKSTQIPQYLYQAGWCNNGRQVVVSQPSKSAVIGTALHVADQVNCEIGQEVGYSIRWRNMTSANTKIKYVTDDLLLREVQLDPLLQQYSVVMLDDVHERTLATDLLIALLKRICKKRTDLRLIVSEATNSPLPLVSFFNADDGSVVGEEPQGDSWKKMARCLVLEPAPQRVDIQRRTEPVEDYFKFAIDTVFEIISQEENGDILVFMTGKAQVYEAIGAVQTRIMDMASSAPDLRLLSLHQGLSRDQQRELFEAVASDSRRVIFGDATAENGVKLEGISFVVDCGWNKIGMYDWTSGVDCQVQVPISKIGAIQRSRQARSGGAGKCFQGYTTANYEAFRESDLPEIERSNFAAALLSLKNLGISNPFKFDYLTIPPDEILLNAAEYLLATGCIDEDFKFSKLGQQLAGLPIGLHMAKSLLAAGPYGCTKEMLSIAAMVETRLSPWTSEMQDEEDSGSSRRLFGVRESDHLTLLNIYLAYTDPQIGRRNRKWCEKHTVSYQTMALADKIRAQLEKYLEKYGIDIEQTLLSSNGKPTAEDKERMGQAIRKCLLTGYFDHVAQRKADGSFQMIRGGRIVHAHKGSFAARYKNDYILFGSTLEHEFKQTEVLEISKVERDWLPEVAPLFYKLQ